MSIELKDWLNSINFSKENLIEDSSSIKDYSPYVINRCLSVKLIVFSSPMK